MQRFYFDHNATTPVAEELLEVLVPALVEDFGNASSIHYYGQRARHRLDAARAQVAGALGCDAKEIVFTSGGTEADNLAVFGVMRHAGRGHVVTSAFEHPAVLNACGQLEREGFQVTYVMPDRAGVVDPDTVRREIREDTVLVSVMHVNNELGTVQPIREIAAIAHDRGVLFHTDGVQALGRVPVDVRALGVDLYSISGHKLYAPKGVGALYVRKGVTLAPVMYGGRHEQQRRAGTENVAGAVGLGWACARAVADLEAEDSRVSVLRDRLERGVSCRVPGVVVNGHGAPRTANTTNLRFEDVRGEALVIGLDLKGFCVSSGAACSSGAVEPSRALTAIGLTAEEARCSIRISLGRSNTEQQVDALIAAIADCTTHLRRLSPVSVAHV